MAQIQQLQGSDKLREAYPKINQNVDSLNAENYSQQHQIIENNEARIKDLNDHKASTDHSADKIKYIGKVNKNNVKDAIDEVDTRIDNIVTNNPTGTKDQEVIDARLSTEKGKTFPTVKARFEEIEGETAKAKYSTPVEVTSNVISLPSTATTGQICVSSIKGRSLKQELNYNRDTLAEWSVSGDSSKDGNILVFKRIDASTSTISLNTNLKPNTKYGFLSQVISTNMSEGLVGCDVDAFSTGSSAILGILFGGTGNRKGIATTLSTITNNRVRFRPQVNNVESRIRDIRAFELPTGSEIETDFNTLSADQLAQKYPYIRGDNAKSTFPAGGRLRSVGKNSLDYKQVKPVLLSGFHSEEQEIYVDSVSISGKGSLFIKLKPSTQYTVSGTVENLISTNRIRIVNDANVFITQFTGVNTTFTSPANGIVEFQFTNNVGASTFRVKFKNIMLNEGSNALPYEPFKDGGKMYVPNVGGSVGSSKDEIRPTASGGYECVKRNSDEQIVKGIAITGGFSSESINTYSMRCGSWSVGKNVLNSTVGSGVGYTNNINIPIGSNTTEDIMQMVFDSSFNLWIRLNKNLVDAMPSGGTIEGCREYLNQYPISVTYQLASPIITQLEGIDKLQSGPGYTIIVEFIDRVTKAYGTGITLSKPVKGATKDNIESVTLISGTTRINVDKASVTLTGNVVTIAGATTNQIYEIVWEYPSEESTLPTIVYSYPLNMAAELASVRSVVFSTDKEFKDYRAYSNAYLFNLEMRISMLEI